MKCKKIKKTKYFQRVDTIFAESAKMEKEAVMYPQTEERIWIDGVGEDEDVIKLLNKLSQLIDYDLSKIDIKDRYTLNIFLSYPERYIEDDSISKKIKDIVKLFNLLDVNEGS